MNEISVPYHLVTPAILCIIGLIVICVFRKNLLGKKLFWLSITVFLVVYCYIVASATFQDIYYQWDLNRYDLDKDGFFGGVEITAEQQEAMRRLTNDVGRNFSVLTGFIFAALVSVGVYIFGRMSNYLFKPKAGNKL